MPPFKTKLQKSICEKILRQISSNFVASFINFHALLFIFMVSFVQRSFQLKICYSNEKQGDNHLRSAGKLTLEVLEKTEICFLSI